MYLGMEKIHIGLLLTLLSIFIWVGFVHLTRAIVGGYKEFLVIRLICCLCNITLLFPYYFYTWITGTKRAPLSKLFIKWSLIIGAIHYFYSSTYAMALIYMSPSTHTAIIMTSPAFVYTISLALRIEAWNYLSGLCVVGLCVGALMVAFAPREGQFILLPGIIAIFSATIFFSAYQILIARLRMKSEIAREAAVKQVLKDAEENPCAIVSNNSPNMDVATLLLSPQDSTSPIQSRTSSVTSHQQHQKYSYQSLSPPAKSIKSSSRDRRVGSPFHAGSSVTHNTQKQSNLLHENTHLSSPLFPAFSSSMSDQVKTQLKSDDFLSETNEKNEHFTLENTSSEPFLQSSVTQSAEGSAASSNVFGSFFKAPTDASSSTKSKGKMHLLTNPQLPRHHFYSSNRHEPVIQVSRDINHFHSDNILSHPKKKFNNMPPFIGGRSVSSYYKGIAKSVRANNNAAITTTDNNAKDAFQIALHIDAISPPFQQLPTEHATQPHLDPTFQKRAVSAPIANALPPFLPSLESLIPPPVSPSPSSNPAVSHAATPPPSSDLPIVTTAATAALLLEHSALELKMEDTAIKALMAIPSPSAVSFAMPSVVLPLDVLHSSSGALVVPSFHVSSSTASSRGRQDPTSGSKAEQVRNAAQAISRDPSARGALLSGTATLANGQIMINEGKKMNSMNEHKNSAIDTANTPNVDNNTGALPNSHYAKDIRVAHRQDGRLLAPSPHYRAILLSDLGFVKGRRASTTPYENGLNRKNNNLDAAGEGENAHAEAGLLAIPHPLSYLAPLRQFSSVSASKNVRDAKGWKSLKEGTQQVDFENRHHNILKKENAENSDSKINTALTGIYQSVNLPPDPIVIGTSNRTDDGFTNTNIHNRHAHKPNNVLFLVVPNTPPKNATTPSLPRSLRKKKSEKSSFFLTQPVDHDDIILLVDVSPPPSPFKAAEPNKIHTLHFLDGQHDHHILKRDKSLTESLEVVTNPIPSFESDISSTHSQDKQQEHELDNTTIDKINLEMGYLHPSSPEVDEPLTRANFKLTMSPVSSLPQFVREPPLLEALRFAAFTGIGGVPFGLTSVLIAHYSGMSTFHFPNWYQLALTILNAYVGTMYTMVLVLALMFVSALIVSMGTPLVLPLITIIGFMSGEKEPWIAYAGMILIIVSVLSKGFITLWIGVKLERVDAQLRATHQHLLPSVLKKPFEDHDDIVGREEGGAGVVKN